MRFNIERYTIYELMVILGIGLLSLSWFQGLLINTSDFALPLDRVRYFLASLSLWDDRHSTGFANPLSTTNLLFGLFSAFTQFTGLPLLYYEMLIFYIWFAGSGISAYIFSRALNLGKVARIISSLVYMMNPFSLTLIWSIGQGMVQIEYAFLPAIVGLFIRGLVKGKGVQYSLGLQLLWFTLGLFGTAANLQLTAVYWFAIFVVYIFYSLNKIIKHDFSSFLKGSKFIVLSIVAFAALNLYWLIPTVSQVDQYFSHYSGVASVAFIPNLDVFRVNSVKIVDAVRLMGYWAFNGGWEGGPYYSWAPIYAGGLMIAISFIIPTVVVLGIRKLKSVALLIAPLYIISLFLIKGVNSPLGWLNEYIFVNFPLFQTTRNVIVTWGLTLTLCTAALFGIGVESLYRCGEMRGKNSITLRYFNRISVVLILFLVIGVLVFPFWTGAVINSPTTEITAVDGRQEVPGYYYDFNKFIENENGDYRILTLPLHNAGNGFYNWRHGYVGPEPIVWFSNKPVVYFNTLLPMHELLGQSFGTKPLPKENLADILSMLNIKYIVVHNDAEWKLVKDYKPQFYYTDPETINATLNAPNIVYDRTIGNLTIYKNTKEINHIYASTNLITMPDNFDSVRQLLPLGVIDANPVVVSEIDKTNATRLFGDARIRVEKMNNNATKIFTPYGTQSRIYVNAPFLNQVIIDGNTVDLFGNSTNLIRRSQVFKWSANGTTKDYVSTTNYSATWNIDRSIPGVRNINFDFDSFNLTDHNIELLIDGDGSSNNMIFQLYDTSGNHIGWSQKMDWNGTKKIELSLKTYDQSSQIPSTFQPAKAKLLAIYYFLGSQEEGYTSVIIRSIKPNLPSDVQWEAPKDTTLFGGQHYIQAPKDQIVYGEVVLVNLNQTAAPKLGYSKISPDEYRVTVVNASNPFYLVFSESFARDWKVYDGNLSFLKTMSSPIIGEKDHRLVNGFANAWYVNKTGTYTLTLFYYPQAVYETALALTIVALAVISITIAWKQNYLNALFNRLTVFGQRVTRSKEKTW